MRHAEAPASDQHMTHSPVGRLFHPGFLSCPRNDLGRQMENSSGKRAFRLDEGHLARYREYAGDGLFRVSIGLEDPEDLCADLAACLDAL